MENEELIQLFQNGDEKALDKLIENNIGIIKKIAIKYNGINKLLELDDLIQEGILGIIKAANKYDLNNDKKAKFITYAVFHIDRYIHSSVNGNSSKYIGNNELNNKCTSLNIYIGEDGESRELGELIEDKDYGFENVEEIIFLKQLREDLEGLMYNYNTLAQREILKFRYGWNAREMTLDDVAEVLCISRERVRNLEKKALRILRNSDWIRENIYEFMELGYINKFDLEIFKRVN